MKNATPSLNLTFFNVFVSGIPPNLRFLDVKDSFAYVVFDPLIFLLLFFPVSMHWVTYDLVGFYKNGVWYRCFMFGLVSNPSVILSSIFDL